MDKPLEDTSIVGDPRHVSVADLVRTHVVHYGAGIRDYSVMVVLNGHQVNAIVTIDTDVLPEGIILRQH